MIFNIKNSTTLIKPLPLPIIIVEDEEKKKQIKDNKPILPLI
jgi:hypothetical protein